MSDSESEYELKDSNDEDNTKVITSSKQQWKRLKATIFDDEAIEDPPWHCPVQNTVFEMVEPPRENFMDAPTQESQKDHVIPITPKIKNQL